MIRNLEALQLAEIKRLPGKDMILFGSGSIATQLTAHALIGEYQFVGVSDVSGPGPSILKRHASIGTIGVGGGTTL